ncbi:MAG: hypothetical protein JSV79_11970 [Armatimonadota bacterium]|nr:MAG: hypothetical protein JSV79_11970 [Armatimonadota bacterium]
MPDPVTHFIYVIAIPAACLIAIVYAVLFYLSPFASSPVEREQRFLAEFRGAHLVW